MTRSQIARASTAVLYERVDYLYAADWDAGECPEIDWIENEIEAREHDNHEPVDYDAQDRSAYTSECYDNLRNER